MHFLFCKKNTMTKTPAQLRDVQILMLYTFIRIETQKNQWNMLIKTCLSLSHCNMTMIFRNLSASQSTSRQPADSLQSRLPSYCWHGNVSNCGSSGGSQSLAESHRSCVPVGRRGRDDALYKATDFGFSMWSWTFLHVLLSHLSHSTWSTVRRFQLSLSSPSTSAGRRLTWLERIMSWR